MTSRRAKIVFAAAIAAGGAAGMLGALGVAVALRTATGASDRQRPAAIPVTDSGTLDVDVDAILHHSRLEDHMREPIDPSWAGEAQHAYERDLRRLALDAGFGLRSVDCRTTTCTADLTFASYGDARTSMQKIMGYRWSLSCLKEMHLDSVADGSSSTYCTTIYFDCTGARATRSASEK
jgi:hypothetical protein